MAGALVHIHWITIELDYMCSRAPICNAGVQYALMLQGGTIINPSEQECNALENNLGRVDNPLVPSDLCLHPNCANLETCKQI